MKRKTNKALILAGGLGTRLRPLTFAVPKPLIVVKDRPIIDYILNQLVNCGINEIFVSVNYRSNLIKLYIEDKDKYGIAIDFFDEIEPLGTAGPLSYMLGDRIRIDKNEPILVMNGDIITDLDFQEIIVWHENNQADLTVGLLEYRHQLSYGVVKMDSNNTIMNITEKPTYSYLASAGIYVVSEKCLSLVPKKFFTMPDLIIAARESGLRVKGFPIKANWLAIEQIKNLEEASVEDKQNWISKIKRMV